MKIIPELIFSTLAILSCLMMHETFPGGVEIFTLSMAILSFFYFPFGFFYLNEISIGKVFLKKTYQDISILRKIGIICAGVIFWMLTFGITFKIRILPGSAELLSVGLLCALIILIVLFIRFFKSNNKQFYKRMLVRCCLFITFGIFFYSTSYLTIIKNLYSTNERLMNIYKEYESNPTDYNKMRLEDKLFESED